MSLQQYAQFTDLDLKILLKKGNERAFEEIYKRYSPKIYQNIKKLVKDNELAQEILQDVFLKIWEKHELIDLDKSFGSFLHVVAQNRVMDFFRKVKRDKTAMDLLIIAASSALTTTDGQAEQNENEMLIYNAIQQLSPQRKIVFTLCKIDGKSYEEVSVLLGISVSTISDHIVKATKFIKKQVESSGEMNLWLIFIAVALQSGRTG